MVKNNNFINGALVLLLFGSPFVGAETQYPASDFQPKVLYSDSDYQHAESAPSSPAKAKGAFDPNFPAASFEPKVLYSDPDYKHKKEVVSAPKSSSSAAVETQSQPTEAEEGSSSNMMLIGLVALVAIGFFFFRSKKGAPTKPKKRSTAAAPVYSAEGAGGLTGVAKYLADKDVKNTGVARYLESREQAPATGVAKYMARQVVAARQAAAERVTGVEKYLRNKG